MSKMIVTDQVINDYTTDVIVSIYNLESVLDVVSENDMSLNEHYAELKKMVHYINAMKTEMTNALHLYDNM